MGSCQHCHQDASRERMLYARPVHAPMQCQRCTATLSPGTAFQLEVPGKPRELLCESCHTTAIVQAGAKFITQRVAVGPIFEYHLVRLTDELNGKEAVERELNKLSAAGWRLMPLAAGAGAFGVMERELHA